MSMKRTLITHLHFKKIEKRIVSKEVSVKMLTTHYNTLVNDRFSIKDFAGVRMWEKKNNFIEFKWNTIFNFLTDIDLTAYNHYSLLIIIHRLYIRRKYKEHYLECVEEKSSSEKLTVEFNKLTVTEKSQIQRQYYQCSNCSGKVYYDYEHALFLCPVVMEFWNIIINMLDMLSKGCFKCVERIGIKTILLLGTDRLNIYHSSYNLELVATVKRIFVIAIESLTEGGTAISGNKMQELFKEKLECIIKDKTSMNNKDNNIWDIFSYTKNEQRIFRITKEQFWFGITK